MKPRNKNERNVVELSERLTPITGEQLAWGYEKCLHNAIHYSAHKMTCLECGKEIPNPLGKKMPKRFICPSCGKKALTYKTKEWTYIEKSYFGIITTMEDYQVIRILLLIKWCKKGYKASYSYSEVMQHWISEKNKQVFLSKHVNGMSLYSDQWIMNSLLEVSGLYTYKQQSRHGIVPYRFYPKMKFLKIFRRNGFTGSFYGMAPQRFLPLLLINPLVETLVKTKQIDLLCYYYGNSGTFNEALLWPSIKICIRNNYIIKDAQNWVDYINLLNYFRKDLHNSFYVCPVNVKQAHDHWMDKKNEAIKNRKLKELREKINIEQIEYHKKRNKFFGLVFNDGKIIVKVLESVEEFMNEGDTLHHCLFTNEYYKKNDSLILSARIDNRPIETIEVSLKELEIKQCHGYENKITKHHSKIIKLVKSNIPQIAKRLTA